MIAKTEFNMLRAVDLSGLNFELDKSRYCEIMIASQSGCSSVLKHTPWFIASRDTFITIKFLVNTINDLLIPHPYICPTHFHKLVA